MNNDIKQALLEGRAILLLGAGASFGSLTHAKQQVPLGEELASILAEKANLPYSGETLSRVYSACIPILGEEIKKIFDNNYRNCKPSSEYITLSKYTFARIYTLNIDDAFEKALERNSKQQLYVKSRNDKVSPPDQLFQKLDFIKLNGDSKRPDDGYIFSPQEYGAASAHPPLWYKELGSDFFNYKFIFIGSKLDEPLFYHQIERYRGSTNSIEQRSYAITPTASPIDIASLLSSNIQHISATLTDFVSWLTTEIPTPLTPGQTLRKSRPEYDISSDDDQEKYMKIFKDVLPVSRTSLQIVNERDSGHPIRNFYKGFKPTWKDIIDHVPAELENTELIFKDLLELIKSTSSINLYCIFGSAGSGKTTISKQIALKLSEQNIPVYYIDSINANLKELITELEKKNTNKYFVFIERIADSAQIIGGIFNEIKKMKGIFIGTESKNIWSYRAKEYFESARYLTKDISLINRRDASKILNKIKLYGNWTRLERMSPSERVKELITKSRKQLLIGLMESTLGEGFYQIIKRDFNRIPTESHKALLALSGIASYQRTNAHESTLTRALLYLNLNANVTELVKQMDGIVFYRNGNIETRHYAYIEKIFDHFLDEKYIYNILEAYINAFTVYNYPIVMNVTKSEAAIYKSLVNSKNLRKLLQNNKDMVLSLYNKFEKTLENEGLYLMQYGIALRDFGMYPEAYEKLKTANAAYPNSPQIEHAFAQLKIIIALQSKTASEAFKLFHEAEEILSRLDGGKVKVIDGYPLVALSEGHIAVLRKFASETEARELATFYYKKIKKMYNNDYSGDTRIEETSEMLFKYATTGVMLKGLETQIAERIFK
ncbi:SIR2 family protein [Yersinia enterocolitica]|uniref:P-loop NTPase n=1 Tax=Yersinia enterocolitica TaxID=630 RepID=UPI003121C426|nr:SIR2 family protein [Yersinia enterocolitica]HDL7952682.1 SIR2 family protein [Yersinia enterocolitica]